MSFRTLKLCVSSFSRKLLRPINVFRTGEQLRVIAMEAVDKKDAPTSVDLVQDKKHTRYKRRFLKRQWEETDAEKKNGESNEKKVCDKPFERIKKKKMAMLLGYCGVNYYGMQRNPGVPTIEEELLKALHEAKYITQEDFDNQQNAQFQRSSRTDKGVSAARQVVSLKLPLEVNVDEINNRLPQCIKVFGIKRATNKFNSKSRCNARTYSYTLPTYVFEPSLLSETERKAYRITAEKITKVNDVLGIYIGTKSYHNFTEKKHYQDPSSLRYMMSFALERVFIESEMEFAELLVKGQSFMLHQIRKMVGLMIAVVRGHTDWGTLEKAFSKEKVMIPTAPGLGLLLDKVHYERYDAKFKDSHDSLTWSEQEQAVEAFKREHIFPSIIKGEIEGNSMGMWLEKIKQHSYEPSNDVPEEQNDCGGDDDDDDDVYDDDKELNEKDKGLKENDKELNKNEKESDVNAKVLKENEKELEGTDKGIEKNEKESDGNAKELKENEKELEGTDKEIDKNEKESYLNTEELEENQKN